MTPPWLAIAQLFKVTKEVPGAVDNPLILGWAKEIGGWEASFYVHDSLPWCGLFVAICCKRANIPVAMNFLGAKNWATWGQALDKSVPGAVMVFERLGGGHVAFYAGEDADSYHTLGGNQSDSVCITRMPKSRCIAIRWPASVTPYGEPVQLTASGQALSTNEA